MGLMLVLILDFLLSFLEIDRMCLKRKFPLIFVTPSINSKQKEAKTN